MILQQSVEAKINDCLTREEEEKSELSSLYKEEVLAVKKIKESLTELEVQAENHNDYLQMNNSHEKERQILKSQVRFSSRDQILEIRNCNFFQF